MVHAAKLHVIGMSVIKDGPIKILTINGNTKPRKGKIPPIEIAPPIIKPAIRSASKYVLSTLSPRLEATSLPRAKRSYLGDLIMLIVRAGSIVKAPI